MQDREIRRRNLTESSLLSRQELMFRCPRAEATEVGNTYHPMSLIALLTEITWLSGARLSSVSRHS